MNTCRTCFYCVPNYSGGMSRFYKGTCYQANRVVQANMTACSIYEERRDTMVVKSKEGARNTYKDKDGNRIVGVTLPEILDKPLTILAKREYTWGKYEGMAVKVLGANGKMAIVEITAKTPIKALCMSDLPKPPYEAKFVQKTSKDGKKYYTIEVENGNKAAVQGEGTDLPF